MIREQFSKSARRIETSDRQTAKKSVEKLTGLARPSWPEVEKAVRVRKPRLVNIDDDGLIPNSLLPLVIYRGAVRLTKTNDPAALFEVLFAHCGWKGSWRNGIYDFAHYHSRTHEVLGLAHGKVLVRFGGVRGRVIELGPVSGYFARGNGPRAD
jgi:hypothetical protein